METQYATGDGLGSTDTILMDFDAWLAAREASSDAVDDLAARFGGVEA